MHKSFRNATHTHQNMQHPCKNPSGHLWFFGGYPAMGISPLPLEKPLVFCGI